MSTFQRCKPPSVPCTLSSGPSAHHRRAESASGEKICVTCATESVARNQVVERTLRSYLINKGKDIRSLMRWRRNVKGERSAHATEEGVKKQCDGYGLRGVSRHREHAGA